MRHRVLHQAEAEHLAAERSWLDRITGPVHDLDVLLARLRSPSKSLDEDRQRLLLTQLEQARAAAQGALAGQLTSERWRCLPKSTDDQRRSRSTPTGTFQSYTQCV